MSKTWHLLSREDLCRITEFVATGVGIAIPIAAALLENRKRNAQMRCLDLGTTVTYEATFSRILNHPTLSEYRKMMLIDSLKKEQETEYYKRLNTILNSKISEYRKMELIEKLNKE